MTLFRSIGRRADRTRHQAPAPAAADMPPRPPQYRPPAQPYPEVWGGSGRRGMQGDPCGSGPLEIKSGSGEGGNQ